MNIHMPKHALFAVIHGPAEELDILEHTLSMWAAQYDPAGFGCAVFVRNASETMRVMVGALLSVRETDWDAPQVEELVERLVEAEFLRVYQADAVLAALVAPHWRSIVQAPGGAGKTHIAAGIIAVGAVAGICEWLYLVQNRELAAQTQRVFDKVLPAMLQVLGDADATVTCASYGTAPVASLRAAQGLLVDECHGVCAPTRAKVIGSMKSVLFRCGLSATPLLRQDSGNALVIGLLGPVCYTIKPARLVSEGYLAKGIHRLVCL